MGKKEFLQTLARKVTGNPSLKCSSVKHALQCIAEKAKGESIKCGSINDALSCLSEHVDNLIGGGGEPLKYHLYAWDYSNGTAIAYSEKEVPQAGDVVFLKEDMEGGKITDTNQLKLIYHVISDADGVITVSEHPEGQAGGYTFNRNDADDYEETVTDVRDLVDITQNGFLMSQKGTMFKGANVSIPSYEQVAKVNMSNNGSKVTCTCATEGAVILYSKDERQTWNIYTEPYDFDSNSYAYAVKAPSKVGSGAVFYLPSEISDQSW